MTALALGLFIAGVGFVAYAVGEAKREGGAAGVRPLVVGLALLLAAAVLYAVHVFQSISETGF